MTPRTATPAPRASLLARFGPLAAVLAAFALVAVLASTGRDDGTSTASAGGSGPSGGSSEAAGGSASDLVPITWDDAKEAGTTDTQQWDSSCDPTTGRIAFPSIYAPPCVAARPGVKGGKTWPGVTADAIKVVLYEPADDDLAASLQAVSDPVDVQRRTREKLVQMFAANYETWGRKIEVVNFKGTGSDETSARADAVTVAEELGAFASIGGPPQEDAYALELAHRKVLCIGCGLSIPDSTFQANAPYLWGTGQPPEQFFVNLGAYLTTRLNKRKAIYAGDASMHDRDRVFGIVNFEQDPPVFTGTTKTLEKLGKANGFESKVHITYQLVLPELGEKARAIVARLKEEGVTTVVFMGDPIMPIYLTKAATDQDYFPEWIVTGTVLTDTTVFGRQYDQKQWAHAFGLGATPVNVPLEQSEAWRTYVWNYGSDPEATNVLRVAYEPIRIFMLGVHMAGPDLTPETFRDGLFHYPVTGGSATAPQVSFGNHGFFQNPDYIGVDDSREIWWKAGVTGPDEQGKETGTGMLYSSNDGARIAPGTMPDTPPDVFDEQDSVSGYDQPIDQPPTYPSPAKPPG